MALEFKLVEIVNQEALPPAADAIEKDSQAQPIEVDGKKGQTLLWLEDQQKYIVETFDGDLVAIKEENLREYEPPPVSEGGFDLAFPESEARMVSFQDEISTLLNEKKYCVVQMSLKLSDRKACARQVQELDNWARFMPEFEPVYMGQRPDGKRVQWYVNDSFAYEETPDLEGALPGLETADSHLSSLAIAVTNISAFLGFQGVCRSNAMIQANCANSEEELNLLDDARGNAVGAGIIQGHLSFYHRRKVCIMYFVNGSGGTLTLHPANREADDITLTCKEGQAVIFRHDLLDYSFLPEGKQLAMSAWIFREMQAGEVSMTAPDLMAYADAIEAIPRGPLYGNNGKSVDNMSFSTRLPGLVNASEHYWTGLTTGYDGVVKIPLTRWDHDIYYHAEPEIAATTGRAYTAHEGMLDNDTQMMCFDNEFFGISAEEVMMIDPLARCSLEVGYDALYRAGWTRAKLLGESMVMVNGITNGEFEGQQLQQLHMRINPQTKNCVSLSATAGRLHYTFGMKGKVGTVETACSSSLTAIGLMHTHMRPDQTGQMKLGSGGKQEKYGLGMGANGHFDPFFMVGLCGAKMLSIQGRCFTFDQSGDGFLRSEGQAAMYFKQSDGEELARLAMLCGTCMNQDGRSASLTAPHGPSQQECIRHSLREANIPPLKIQMQELHGTGTALGDPIEVGALRATMMMYQGEIREHPLVKTSSKSNIGHTELCAGICGIIKCVLMGTYCTGCPNNHIRLLNPHIDSNAYPVYFLTEALDQGKNEGYLGVSSFGFGGSNARGDIWARALAGPRNTDPGDPRAQFTADRIFVWGEVMKQSCPRLKHDEEMQNVLNDMADYDDAYMVGEQPGDDDTIYCIGSFNGWTTPEKMVFVEESGAYIFSMPLGEACVEQFQIIMNKNENFKIFPASKMADQSAFVLGPGISPVGNHWVIDGRPQRLPAGTVFHITLQWDMETRKKTVTWEPSVDEYMLSLASELSPYKHRYHIMGSWTVWKPLEMMPARGGKPGTFETTMKIGIQRKEEFRFRRDGDKFQSIYPARQRVSDKDDQAAVYQWTEAGVRAVVDKAEQYGHPQTGATFTPDHLSVALTSDPDITVENLAGLGWITNSGAQSVPAIGPDHLGEKKFWTVTGAMGEEVKITLRVWEGEVSVVCASAKTGVKIWTNDQVAMRRRYFVRFSTSDTVFLPMEVDRTSKNCKVHKFCVPVQKKGWQGFQIVVDEDLAQTIHPDMPMTDQGCSPAMGPDAKGKNCWWMFHAEKGDVVDIKLDLSQPDRRKVVTWEYNAPKMLPPASA